jgi:8-oxo-dGTP diphosphatase
MIREYFRAIPAAYVIMLQDNKVLLLRRKNTGYADGMLALPAGHIDGDEFAANAAARETLEEVGVSIEANLLTFVHVSHRLNRNEPDQERIDFFFTANKWHGEPFNAEPTKSSEIVWASLDDLPHDLTPYLRAVLTHVRNNRYYSEFEVDLIN